MVAKTTFHCDWCGDPVRLYKSGDGVSFAMMKDEVTEDERAQYTPHFAATVSVTKLDRHFTDTTDPTESICVQCLKGLAALREGKWRRIVGEQVSQDDSEPQRLRDGAKL